MAIVVVVVIDDFFYSEEPIGMMFLLIYDHLQQQG